MTFPFAEYGQSSKILIREAIHLRVNLAVVNL